MATDTQVRKNIQCCKCGKLFTLLIDTAGEPERFVSCLYCGSPLVIKPGKYPKTESHVMRAPGDKASTTVTMYLLPEVLETEERVV